MADDTETQTDDPSAEFALGVIAGEISSESTVDLFAAVESANTVDELLANVNTWEATQQAVMSPEAFTALQETLDPLTDAVNDGIVPPAQAMNFWFWFAYNAGVTLIPAAGIYAFVQGYVLKWAQQNGWATYGPNPQPTPEVQAVIESANAAQPLPGAANPPADLPSPSRGQTTVAAAGRAITPSVVPATGLSPTAAAQVQAAIGVAAADVLKAQAAVIDAFLPNMAPGQVPEALSQLNTAVNALENQLQQVRNGQWPRGFTGLQEAFNGAEQALHGLSQEVGILAQQMATKADSGLEDAITAVKTEADTTAGQVATVLGTTVPFLEGELGTLTGQFNGLADTVNNTVTPELSQLETQVKANTDKLNLTDDECLEALCDSISNVTNPIEEGGSTPGLLKNLGGLLTKALEIGGLMSLLEVIVTLADTKLAISAIVADTETITSWSTKAAGVIESDFSLSGWG